MDIEAIKLPLAIFLVGLVILCTGWVFYKSLTRNNAASGRRVAGQLYLFGRAVIALLILAVLVGVIQWIAVGFK